MHSNRQLCGKTFCRSLPLRTSTHVHVRRREEELEPGCVPHVTDERGRWTTESPQNPKLSMCSRSKQQSCSPRLTQGTNTPSTINQTQSIDGWLVNRSTTAPGFDRYGIVRTVKGWTVSEMSSRSQPTSKLTFVVLVNRTNADVALIPWVCILGNSFNGINSVNICLIMSDLWFSCRSCWSCL